MAEFVKDDDLNKAIIKIIENAKKKLLIVSPYIKLHDRVKQALRSKIKSDKLEIYILYGKNEKKVHESLSPEDYNFFKSFPNICIKHEPRLHAKFYSNKYDSLITSLNLIDASQNKNIEAGVFIEDSNIKTLLNRFDQKAFSYFESLFISTVDTHLQIIPKYKLNKAGIKFKYLGSEIKIDESKRLHGYSNIDSNGTSNIQKVFAQKKSPQAYNPWTKIMERELEQLYCEGKSTTELAQRLGRTQRAIAIRIEKLELNMKYGKINKGAN